MPLTVLRDAPLAPLTTFELGGPARLLVEVSDEAQLIEALDLARAQSLEVLVLGGGSNLVVADRGLDGLVVRLAMPGIEMRREGDRMLVTVGAGEVWDPFVARMVAAGLAGLECLAGIPGLVGATPIQNVGAYGQEVSETIVEVRSIDARTREVRTRTGAQCAFGYRHSLFKEASARDEIVTAVTFALHDGGAPTIRYPELERALVAAKVGATIANVREVVLSLRRAKSMVIDDDDPNRRSAGSFFVNPVVTRTEADAIVARAIDAGVAHQPNEVPQFPSGDRVKLSAGWLIERAGFAKGTRRGHVGISSKHALALVHHGGGTSSELIALAREVVVAVEARFGVRLRPEPVRVGFLAEEAI